MKACKIRTVGREELIIWGVEGSSVNEGHLYLFIDKKITAIVAAGQWVSCTHEDIPLPLANAAIAPEA